MMFLILDKDPRVSARYLIENAPRILKCKQLLELGQLICSCGYSNVYKKVQQGKEIQRWIKKNVAWVSAYYGELLKYCLIDSGYSYSPVTVAKFYTIYKDIRNKCLGVYIIDKWEPRTGILRYTEDYTGSSYKSNSEILIEDCIKEYKNYLKWKNRILAMKADKRKQKRLQERKSRVVFQNM